MTKIGLRRKWDSYLLLLEETQNGGRSRRKRRWLLGDLYGALSRRIWKYHQATAVWRSAPDKCAQNS